VATNRLKISKQITKRIFNEELILDNNSNLIIANKYLFHNNLKDRRYRQILDMVNKRHPRKLKDHHKVAMKIQM